MRKYKFNHFHHDVFNEILGVLRFEAERKLLAVWCMNQEPGRFA